MEDTPFDSYTPAPTPVQPPKNTIVKKIFLSLILLLFVVGVGVASYQWLQVRAENARLQALQDEIRKVVIADNALALEILEMDDSSHITYAEYFKRTEKNKEERDELIRRVRTIEADIYTQDVQNFIRLMEMETEFVRAEEAAMRQQIEVSSEMDSLKEAGTTSEEARKELQEAQQKYFAAPYGEDYSERFAVELAESRIDRANDQSTEAFKEYKEASVKLKEQNSAAALAAKDWLRGETRLYPKFAPSRDLSNLLIKRIGKYDPTVAPEEKIKNVAKNENDTATAIDSNIKKVSTEKASNLPTTPTRVRSLQPLDGERFPETRMREITPDEVTSLSDEDLRYVINEMYARYGMTFKDKTYQANFEGTKWYQPNERWTPEQIERSFNSTERKNFRTLTRERAARQQLSQPE